MEKDGKSKRFYDNLTVRKIAILLISGISIISIILLCINYLHFNTYSNAFLYDF